MFKNIFHSEIRPWSKYGTVILPGNIYCIKYAVSTLHCVARLDGTMNAYTVQAVQARIRQFLDWGKWGILVLDQDIGQAIFWSKGI